MPRRKKTDKVAYFNRELSWLAFNRRVLDQAFDARYPLLERLRFLSFVASNLDEFFEIRVSGVMQQVDSKVTEGSGPDGLGPKEQLRRIHAIVTTLVKDKYRCWREDLVPSMKAKGIVFKTKEELTRREGQWLKTYFEEQIFPVLTPLATDPAHPFPHFGNKTLNILLWLDDPSTTEVERMLAFLPVPRILPRVVRIPGSTRTPPTYIFLSEIVKLFISRLFPGYRVHGVHAFRITRNSDLYFDEEECENLLQTIEEELYNRRKGAAVRLEIEEGVDEGLLHQLLKAIRLGPEHVFRINGPINLMRLMPVYDVIDRPDLKFKSHIPYLPSALAKPDAIFDQIRKEDRLLHHPYDSFQPVIDFVRQAAVDPACLAIKLTLYRTGSDSPIIAALKEAARHDKQVTALVELKARFDEERNIQWAKELEEAGVHVVYGFVGLKTHCKCVLIVRREGEHLRRYAHLGTGNYHAKTARLYTDLSYFTCRPEITDDVAEVFNTLTGYARRPSFKKLLAAPFTLHATMQKLIQQEARNARKGLPAHIIVKCNSLIDKETIDALYSASTAGVKIDLIIRGICGLVPGIKGMSENIRVRSILGRFLEHSRVFYFKNAGKDPLVYIGSADWMPRNFYRRIEVVTPVEDPGPRQRIIDEVLGLALQDTAFATELRPNGAYLPVKPRKGEEEFSSQKKFVQLSEQARAEAEQKDPLAHSSGPLPAERLFNEPERAQAKPSITPEEIPEAEAEAIAKDNRLA